ncbi:hypothetical protein [Collimonas sp.]|uniref:hypothetical protein n=1 Tax=Collimonas sp. TaxID=1963772 RepID=UPI002C38BB55|nr:hypothetical protein [Collimonas sp.]HWX01417.1 hypothetical protein [Collimonas sp.]
MTLKAKELARATFRMANGVGPAEQPKSLQQFVSQVRSTDGPLSTLDTQSLAQSVYAEFQFLGPLVRDGIMPDSASMARWEAAVRWILTGLRNWNSNKTNALIELQALLTSVQALDADSAGLENIAALLDGDEMEDALLGLVENANVGPFGGVDRRFPNLAQDLKVATQQGEYRGLGYILPQVMPEFRSDLSAAVILLWKLVPGKLAIAVSKKDEVLFSMFVCRSLRENAAHFALDVPLGSFKFVSISDIPCGPKIDRTTQVWGDLLRQILVQVAETSDWVGWMLALYRSPHSESNAGSALADALVDLEEGHWFAFVQALSLGHSHAAAGPVAQIMARFASRVEASKAKIMWSIAFARWDEWNYAKGEQQTYLFAPASCALDYPVSMYYSQLSGPELDKEDARLTKIVEQIEQQWFESASDLTTERNRLLSRLRLVRHAMELRVSDANLLPPAIQPDAAPYARLRYLYYDIHHRESPSA